ncbi:MAG TPA: glycosyltransferase family 4 protein, partial [Candidatus Moranbacteria bacterium]|nr:glycosyltransferase family 4 protein [Candidatus Moranbacteria bacterium]
MKIAIFTNNYLPNPYGVSGSIESFRQEFEKQGHTVFIFAPKFKEYKDKNPKVFRYPAIDIKVKFRFPLAIPYSKKMDKIIEKLNLDIIHIQHPNLLGKVGAKWAKKKKIPLIFTWHTLYDHYTNFIPFLPAQISAGYMIKKAVQIANQSETVIIPTDSIRTILKKWGVQKRMVAIATGVEEKDFSEASKNFIRKKYDIAKSEIVLLLVSRLTEEKNVEFVFRS